MRVTLASALCLVLAGSAWGQHAGSGGHGGGTAPRSSGIASGRSFAPPATSAPRSFGSAPAYRPSAPSQQRSFQYSSPTGPAPFGGTYPYGERARGGQRGDGHRREYVRGVYAVPGWLSYGYGGGYGFGYSDGAGDQQPVAADPNAAAAAPDGYADSGDPQQGYGPPARPPYQPETASPAPDPQTQPQVTLMFKDGRAPVRVQNYALTRTTVYILDGAHRREIQLDQLDLPLTEQANRDAGIDFAVPAAAY